MGPELCRFLSDSSGGGPRAHTGNGLPLGPVRSSGAWGRVGVEAVGAGGSPGRYPPPPVSLRRLPCTMAADTWPVPWKGCLQAKQKRLQVAPLSTFFEGRGHRAPLTHTCLPDPKHPQGTGHLSRLPPPWCPWPTTPLMHLGPGRP